MSGEANLQKPAENSSDVVGKIQLTWEADSHEKTMQLYDGWADTYDTDLVGDVVAYNPPKITARYVAKFVPDVSAKIVDICCGTGLVGHELSAKGYKVIDGIDASPKMLEKARSRNVYRSLTVGFLGPKPLDIPAGSYDALSACGCFLPGHLKGDCFQELARLVRIGGLVIIAYNKDYAATAPEYVKDIMDAQVRLSKQGIWEEIYHEVVAEYFTVDNNHVDGIVKVFVVRAHTS